MQNQTIDTGLKGQKQLKIMNRLIGQMSDGKWENSRAMEKYWKNCRFYLGEGGKVMLEVKSPFVFRGQSEEEILSWFADKVKAVVKDEEEYYGTEWKRDSKTPTRFLGDWRAEGVITVGDCYKVYDVLKGRRLDNKAYAESKEEDYLKAVEEYEKARG